MDSDAILTAVNAVESITNPPHTPERSSYRARKTVEQIVHLIFLLCGIVAVAFVLLISIYLILSGLPAIRQIGLVQFLFGKVWDPTNTTTGAQYGIFALSSPRSTAPPEPLSSVCRWDLWRRCILRKWPISACAPWSLRQCRCLQAFPRSFTALLV